MRVVLDTGRRHEGAFTIIEMVVALALFALAMAAAMPALGNMLDIGNRGAANAQASSDASYALQLVEADLRRAQGVRGSGTFEDATGADSVYSALSDSADLRHDVLAAGPTQLELLSDVLGSNAGPERVRYVLRQQTSRSASGPCDRQARTSWCVIRTVSTAAGGALVTEVIAHGAGQFPVDRACIPNDGSGGAVRLFCYQHKAPARPGPLPARYAWGGWTSACVASWAAPTFGATYDWNTRLVTDRTRFSTYHDRVNSANTSVRALDTISAIGIVMPAGGRTDGARAITTSVTTVDLRNRGSEEYLRAIMCGSR